MKVERARQLDERDHRSLVLWAADCAVVPPDAAAAAAERDWQYRRLPEHLRPTAIPARGTG